MLEKNRLEYNVVILGRVYEAQGGKHIVFRILSQNDRLLTNAFVIRLIFCVLIFVINL